MTSRGNAEIWDDSALVDSWNDALEEYKRYHSIQARGENVEEMLRKHENQSNGGANGDEDGEVEEQRVHGHQAKSLPEETADHDTTSPGSGSPVKNKLSISDTMPDEATNHGPMKRPALPQHLIGQVHDDNMKNLLMSWYYAGYYTGLYEGQQQGNSAKHEN